MSPSLFGGLASPPCLKKDVGGGREESGSLCMRTRNQNKKSHLELTKLLPDDHMIH